MARGSLAAALLLSLACAGCTAGPDVERGGISGIVMDDGYRPVPDALVFLEGKGATATTDQLGQFVFSDLPAGNYTLLLNKDGLEAAPASVEVKAGQTTEVELSGRRAFTGNDVLTFAANGTTTANAAGWGLDGSLAMGIRALDLPVPPNATGLIVEVTWSGAGSQDLDLEVHAPKQTSANDPETAAAWAKCDAGQPTPGLWCDAEGNLGDPDSPIRLELSAEDLAPYAEAECTGKEYGDCNVYAVGLRSKDANAGVKWIMVVSVFTGAPPPEGYSVLN